MDKETLSNYGWIVICVLVLAVMLTFATPFGKFVQLAVSNYVAGLKDVNDEVFSDDYMDGIVKEWEDKFLDNEPNDDDTSSDDKPIEIQPAPCNSEGHYIGDGRGLHGIAVTACDNGHTYTCECNVWTVPLDGKYTMATAINEKSVYVGEKLPCGYITQEGDVYTYGDYEYTYATSWGGWGVAINTEVTDKNQASYDSILESINEKPVTSMQNTFMNCKSLTTAPAIPSSVTNVQYTFNGCTSLVTAPAIPSGVTGMYGTFRGCTSLTTAPTIPNNVKTMQTIFYGCTSLKTYVGSTDSDGDFSGYVIPSSVTNMNSTFQGCTLLTSAPAIPSSVTNMSTTFRKCTSLVSAPTIPSSVTNMYGTFRDCTSLTGIIEINSTPTNYDYCLGGTQITGIAGSCTIKDELIATK